MKTIADTPIKAICFIGAAIALTQWILVLAAAFFFHRETDASLWILTVVSGIFCMTTFMIVYLIPDEELNIPFEVSAVNRKQVAYDVKLTVSMMMVEIQLLFLTLSMCNLSRLNSVNWIILLFLSFVIATAVIGIRIARNDNQT